MLYSKKVMQHFFHPKNVGSIKNPDAIGKAGNIYCGDTMQIYLKIEKGKIKDIKFKTLGCAAAIATSSMITEMTKGKTLEKARKITSIQLAKKLGGLPPIKIHCSVLATDALAEAIYNYYKKHKMQIPPELKRRHEKIIREIKETEKRYKEFVKAQKKWMKNG